MRAQGGDPCRTSSFRPGGRFCPDVSVPATFYHSLSLSRDVADRFRITLGVANLFDTPQPRVSTVVTASPPVIGQDRKSAVSGKSVSVRVDLGGRRIIKQKHDYKY